MISLHMRGIEAKDTVVLCDAMRQTRFDQPIKNPIKRDTVETMSGQCRFHFMMTQSVVSQKKQIQYRNASGCCACAERVNAGGRAIHALIGA